MLSFHQIRQGKHLARLVWTHHIILKFQLRNLKNLSGPVK